MNQNEAILIEEQEIFYLTHCPEDKWFHAFPKVIGPKVSRATGIKLAHCKAAVLLFRHYATGASSHETKRKDVSSNLLNVISTPYNHLMFFFYLFVNI